MAFSAFEIIILSLQYLQINSSLAHEANIKNGKLIIFAWAIEGRGHTPECQCQCQKRKQNKKKVPMPFLAKLASALYGFCGLCQKMPQFHIPLRLHSP
jgi:hypothetical protein